MNECMTAYITAYIDNVWVISNIQSYIQGFLQIQDITDYLQNLIYTPNHGKTFH